MRTKLTLATWGRATLQGLHGIRGVRREMQAPLQPGFHKCRVAPVLYINMKAGFSTPAHPPFSDGMVVEPSVLCSSNVLCALRIISAE